MDKKLKAKWISALRSGGYQQGRFYLRDDEGRYCCLGILHKIITGEEPGKCWTDEPVVARPDLMKFIDDPSPTVAGETVQNTLVLMNDNGKTFPEIADYIEKNL